MHDSRNKRKRKLNSPLAAPVTLTYEKQENTKGRLSIDSDKLYKIVVPQ